MKHYIRETSGPNSGAIHELPTKQAALKLERELNALCPNSTDYGTDRDGFVETHLKNRETAMSTPTQITLPPFSLLQKQPKIPHVARTVAQNDVENEHGTPITFIVSQSRNGRSWWIRAAREGMRMSNTLHTTVPSKAATWIRAVQTGKVSVARETSLTCDMRVSCTSIVTHIDNKGYVYCTGHGIDRKAAVPCRALRPGEITKLILGETIKY